MLQLTEKVLNRIGAWIVWNSINKLIILLYFFFYKIFKKYSLLIAINTKGVVGWKRYEEGAVNSDRLTEFIRENITSKFEDNVVIMDNAGFHKTQDVKKEIQEKNNFIYTIPYYPRSNPIEIF